MQPNSNPRSWWASLFTSFTNHQQANGVIKRISGSAGTDATQAQQIKQQQQEWQLKQHQLEQMKLQIDALTLKARLHSVRLSKPQLSSFPLGSLTTEEELDAATATPAAKEDESDTLITTNEHSTSKYTLLEETEPTGQKETTVLARIHDHLKQCRDASETLGTIGKELKQLSTAKDQLRPHDNDTDTELTTKMQALEDAIDSLTYNLNQKRIDMVSLHYNQIMGIRSERIAPTCLFCCPCLKKPTIQYKSTNLASQYPSMFDLFQQMQWDQRDQPGKKTAPTVMQYMTKFDISEQTITELREYALQETTSETDFNLVCSQMMETKHCSTRDLSGFIEQHQSAALKTNEEDGQATPVLTVST